MLKPSPVTCTNGYAGGVGARVQPQWADKDVLQIPTASGEASEALLDYFTRPALGWQKIKSYLAASTPLPCTPDSWRRLLTAHGRSLPPA